MGLEQLLQEFLKLIGAVVDLGQYAGIMMLVTVVIDILKAVGVIKKPEVGGVIATVFQTVFSVLLFVVGLLSPAWLDSFPLIDQFAKAFAELGVGILAIIPLIVKLMNLFHDVFGNVPGVNKVVGRKIT